MPRPRVTTAPRSNVQTNSRACRCLCPSEQDLAFSASRVSQSLPGLEVRYDRRTLELSVKFASLIAIQPVACTPPLPRNKKVNTNPARNPPMCAMYATPPVCAVLAMEPMPLKNCRMIQIPMTISAGT